MTGRWFRVFVTQKSFERSAKTKLTQSNQPFSLSPVGELPTIRSVSTVVVPVVAVADGTSESLVVVVVVVVVVEVEPTPLPDVVVALGSTVVDAPVVSATVGYC
jgi:hypothetical protein